MRDFCLTTKAFVESTRTGTPIKLRRHKWSQFCMTRLLECFIQFLSVKLLIADISKGISIQLEDANGVVSFLTMSQEALEQLKQDTSYPACINVFIFDLGRATFCNLMERGSHLARASDYLDCTAHPYINLDVSVVLVVKDLIFDDYDILLLFLMTGTLGRGVIGKKDEWSNFHIMAETLVDKRQVLDPVSNSGIESIESMVFNRFSWLFLHRNNQGERLI